MKRVLIVLSIAVIIMTGVFFRLHAKPVTSKATIRHITPSLPPPTDHPFGKYTVPKIPNKDAYRIAMVGDSMTAAMGIFGGKLSEYLNTLYQSTPGHQRIIVDNYAVGSTNILDLQKQITTKYMSGGVTLDTIVSVKPDMILIESFGYNPLSQLGLVQGQIQQTKTLDETMKFLTTNLPNTAVVFVATIAPNRETYALEENPGEPLLQRAAEADERSAYIKNHMSYATTHAIPLIDIYDKSVTQNGDGNILYINPTDHIHPSFAGLDFIDHEIANFIYASKILPQ